MTANQIARELEQVASRIRTIEPELEEGRTLKTAALVLRNNLEYHTGERGEQIIECIKLLEEMAGSWTETYKVES
jgi:hypothetical protein